MSSKAQHSLHVVGKISDPGFQQAKVFARALADEYSTVAASTEQLLESEWELYIRQAHTDVGEAARKHTVSPLVTLNGGYLGGVQQLLDFAAATFGFRMKLNNVLYTRIANTEYKRFLDTNKLPFAFLDISIDGGTSTRVVLELRTDICERTCENFLALCTGSKGKSEAGNNLHYKDTPIHRVVQDGWVQGGDIAGGHGDGGESIFGPTFADECFTQSHDQPGIISMANKGEPHSNNSQFFVTLAPMTWMDRQSVAFGRVISGMRVFREIAKLETLNERPVKSVKVVDCGEYNSAVYSGKK